MHCLPHFNWRKPIYTIHILGIYEKEKNDDRISQLWRQRKKEFCRLLYNTLLDIRATHKTITLRIKRAESPLTLNEIDITYDWNWCSIENWPYLQKERKPGWGAHSLVENKSTNNWRIMYIRRIFCNTHPYYTHL